MGVELFILFVKLRAGIFPDRVREIYGKMALLKP
jgi:hypothetical protein